MCCYGQEWRRYDTNRDKTDQFFGAIRDRISLKPFRTEKCYTVTAAIKAFS